MNREYRQDEPRRNNRGIPVVFALAMLCSLVVFSRMSRGQTAWEVTPYKVKVLLASDRTPAWSPALTGRIEQHLQTRLESIFGAAWRLQVEPAPLSLVYDMSRHPERLTSKRLATALDINDLRRLDKLFLLGLARTPEGFSVSCREFDCNTRFLSPTVAFNTRQTTVLPESAVQAVTDSFSPVVRYGRAEKDQVVVRVRAGVLIVDPLSPAALHKGDVLMPFIRRNDRLGDPRPGGIERIEWTWLVLQQWLDFASVETEQEEIPTEDEGESEESDAAPEEEQTTEEQARNFRALCNIYSGRRSPLRGRASVSTWRLATRVKPIDRPTRLHLSNNAEPHGPLVGFEVLAAEPEVKQPEKLGRTDWRGIIDIPPTLSGQPTPLMMVYVRQGRHPIARLPIVPGFSVKLDASLPESTGRQQAEAWLALFRTELIDLVYRRALLEQQIRREMKEGNQESAVALLRKFRNLPTLLQMQNKIRTMRNAFPIKDGKVRTLVRRYFDEMNGTTAKYIVPEKYNELAELVEKGAAESGS